MGDPRSIRKNFNTPRHPWMGHRIEDEKKLKYEYGISNKKEIWKMGSTLVGFKDRLKSLFARTDTQGEIERQQLMDRMTKLGLGRMPHVGSNVVDKEAVELIAAWIKQQRDPKQTGILQDR